MRDAIRHSPVLIVAAACALLPAADARPQTTAPVRNAAPSYEKAFALLPKGLSRKQQELLAARGRLKAEAPDPAISALLTKSRPALELLLAAARYKKCDWPADKAGIDVTALWARLSNASSLGKLGLLGARYHFARGQAPAGIEHLAATMTLGRRVGSSAPMVALLTQIRIDNAAAEVAANHLALLSPAELKALAERLEAVPQGPSPGGALRQEKALLAQSTPGHDMYDQIAKFYDAAAEIADLPPDAFAAKLKAIEAAPPPSLAPTILRASSLHAAARARTAMLKAAIAVFRDDPKAFQSVKDPYGDGPFERKQLANGFQLTSNLRVDRKPVTLSVPGRG